MPLLAVANMVAGDRTQHFHTLNRTITILDCAWGPHETISLCSSSSRTDRTRSAHVTLLQQHPLHPSMREQLHIQLKLERVGCTSSGSSSVSPWLRNSMNPCTEGLRSCNPYANRDSASRCNMFTARLRNHSMLLHQERDQPQLLQLHQA
jgi:hypothetical protein